MAKSPTMYAWHTAYEDKIHLKGSLLLQSKATIAFA